MLPTHSDVTDSLQNYALAQERMEVARQKHAARVVKKRQVVTAASGKNKVLEEGKCAQLLM